MQLAMLMLCGLSLTAEPVSDAVQSAIEARLARAAVEPVHGSIERASGPDCAPYRFFTYRDTQAGKVRGVAVSDSGELALADDPVSLGRFFEQTKFFERHGPTDALEIWRVLTQGPAILDAPAIARLPEDERAAVFPARREEREGGARVVGFVRQGEETFRVQLDVTASRAEVTLRTLGEVLGRDEIDQATRALRSADEVVRAAAVFELAEKKDARAFQAVLGALQDRSGNVRGTVAQALKRQVELDAARKPEVVAALKKVLAREPDEVARAQLSEVLEALEPRMRKGK